MPIHPLSMRSARGAGWHKRGYRDMGSMWLNIRHAYFDGSGYTRGSDFNENLTMGEFIQSVIRGVNMEEGFQYPSPCPTGKLYIGVERYRKSLADEPEDAMITDYFDGGESLSIKVYDAEGDELVLDLSTSRWVYK